MKERFIAVGWLFPRWPLRLSVNVIIHWLFVLFWEVIPKIEIVIIRQRAPIRRDMTLHVILPGGTCTWLDKCTDCTMKTLCLAVVQNSRPDVLMATYKWNTLIEECNELTSELSLLYPLLINWSFLLFAVWFSCQRCMVFFLFNRLQNLPANVCYVNIKP